MPHAITYIKINQKFSELARVKLKELVNSNSLKEKNVVFEHLFESFGWSDFIVILNGVNIEDLKKTIAFIRRYLAEQGIEDVETSTNVGLSILE